MIRSYPKRFDGTDEQKRANQRSHSFTRTDYYDPDSDMRCSRCDVRPLSVSSYYPCGATVPRVEVAAAT